MESYVYTWDNFLPQLNHYLGGGEHYSMLCVCGQCVGMSVCVYKLI